LPCVASSPGFPVHEATAVSQACLAGGRGRVWRSTRWTWVKNIQWRDFLTQDSRFLDLESSWASFLARQQSLESALRYDGFWHVFRYSPVMKHSWEIIFVRNGHLKSWKPGQHTDSFCMFLPDVTSHRDVMSTKKTTVTLEALSLTSCSKTSLFFSRNGYIMVYHGIIPGLFTAKDTPLDQIGGYVHRYASFLGPVWVDSPQNQWDQEPAARWSTICGSDIRKGTSPWSTMTWCPWRLEVGGRCSKRFVHVCPQEGMISKTFKNIFYATID